MGEIKSCSSKSLRNAPPRPRPTRMHWYWYPALPTIERWAGQVFYTQLQSFNLPSCMFPTKDGVLWQHFPLWYFLLKCSSSQLLSVSIGIVGAWTFPVQLMVSSPSKQSDKHWKQKSVGIKTTLSCNNSVQYIQLYTGCFFTGSPLKS